MSFPGLVRFYSEKQRQKLLRLDELIKSIFIFINIS